MCLSASKNTRQLPLPVPCPKKNLSQAVTVGEFGDGSGDDDDDDDGDGDDAASLRSAQCAVERQTCKLQNTWSCSNLLTR